MTPPARPPRQSVPLRVLHPCGLSSVRTTRAIPWQAHPLATVSGSAVSTYSDEPHQAKLQELFSVQIQRVLYTSEKKSSLEGMAVDRPAKKFIRSTSQYPLDQQMPITLMHSAGIVLRRNAGLIRAVAGLTSDSIGGPITSPMPCQTLVLPSTFEILGAPVQRIHFEGPPSQAHP